MQLVTTAISQGTDNTVKITSLLCHCRCGYLPSEGMACAPDSAQDHALKLHVDSMCRRLDITSSQLHCWEIILSEAELASSQLVPLQGNCLLCTYLCIFNFIGLSVCLSSFIVYLSVHLY